MERIKLDRDKHHAVSVYKHDKISFWDSPFGDNRTNVTIEDYEGRSVITLFKLTAEQLKKMRDMIDEILSRPPEPDQGEARDNFDYDSF